MSSIVIVKNVRQTHIFAFGSIIFDIKSILLTNLLLITHIFFPNILVVNSTFGCYELKMEARSVDCKK